MKNLLFVSILGIIIFSLFFPMIIFNSFENSFYLFFFSVFPSLFLMLICSEIIINYELANGFLPIIEFITKPYKIKGYASLIFFLSIFTGTPGNSKLIGSALKKQQINQDQAEQLLCISSFFNPLFVINTIGFKLFNNQNIGIILFISMFIINLIIALFFKKTNYQYQPIKHSKITFNDIIISSLKTLSIIFVIIFISSIILNLRIRYSTNLKVVKY